LKRESVSVAIEDEVANGEWRGRDSSNKRRLVALKLGVDISTLRILQPR
jgi:hypothetical protein